MEAIPPKKAVMAAAAVLLLLAGFGAYQGWRRSATDQEAAGDANGLFPAAVPVAGAKNAAPVLEPPAPILSEAQVREIARQEARAALGRSDGGAATSEGAPAAAEAGKPATPAGGAPAAEPARPAAPTESAPTGGTPPPLY